jgi:hypothetical protein
MKLNVHRSGQGFLFAGSRLGRGMTLGLALGILCSTGKPLWPAPPASKQDHCRRFPLSKDNFIYSATEVLMDNKFIIRTVNMERGMLNFYKVVQSERPTVRHIVKLEGTLLIVSRENHAVTVQMIINQEWQDVLANGFAQAGVETDTNESYYTEIFNTLTEAIVNKKK